MTTALLVSSALLFVAAWRIVDLQRQIVRQERTSHAKCIAHVASVVSTRAAAETLRHAAEHADTPTGQREIAALKRDWKPEGPALLSLWLRYRADNIERGNLR